jgi:hypothetical protein
MPLRLFPKIQIVILSEAKNLIFFFSSQKIKKSSFGLQPQDDSEELVDKYQKKDNLICHSAAD